MLIIGVTHFCQGEPLGNNDRKSVGLDGVSQNAFQLVLRQIAQADSKHAADQRAHHRMAESVSSNVGNKHTELITNPPVVQQGAHSGGAFTRLTECGEIVQADELLRRGIHDGHIQFTRMPQSVPAAARISQAYRVSDPILVASPQR